MFSRYSTCTRLGGHEHVRRLDIAVRDPVLVNPREGLEHVAEQPQHAAESRSAALARPRREVADKIALGKVWHLRGPVGRER